MPVNKTLAQFHEENDGHDFHLLLKNLDGRTSALTLHADGTVEELLELAAACSWKDDIPAAVRLNGQRVTNIKQRLSAYGFMGSQCLVIVHEASHMKLEGGMEK